MKNKKERLISAFSFDWWIYFAVIVISIAILTITLKNSERNVKLLVMAIIAFANFTYLNIYKYNWLKNDGQIYYNFFNELPLQLCNIAIILAFFGSIFDSTSLQAFCFCIASPGAFLALLMPDEGFHHIPPYCKRALGYYFYHVFVIVVGISFVATRLYVPEYSDLPKILLVLICILLFDHIVNTIFRKTGLEPKCNYLYTYGLNTNPILKKIKDVIKLDLVYTFPIALLSVLIGAVEIFIAKFFL